MPGGVAGAQSGILTAPMPILTVRYWPLIRDQDTELIGRYRPITAVGMRVS